MQFFTLLTLFAAQASSMALSLRSAEPVEADAAGVQLEMSLGAAHLERRATLDAFSQSVLTTHNAARKKYGAGQLTYATNLNASVAAYAAACVFQHSTQKPAGQYGENLYAATSGSTTMQSAINSWMAEQKSYDYSKAKFSDATGHFTQVVWKDTTKVACSMAFCKKGTIFADYSARYIVCRYTTPGNYAGEFADNVSKPVTVG